MSYQLYDRRRWMSLSRKNYYPFADPVVGQIVANHIGDGIGTTLETIQSCTSNMTSWFKTNTSITEFLELEEFINISNIKEILSNCTNLKKVSFPDLSHISSTNTQYACYKCSNLEEVHFNNTMSVGSYMFYSCPKWSRLYYPNLEVALSQRWGISRPDIYGNQPFYFNTGSGRLGRVYINGVQLTELVVPSTITVIEQACLVNTTELVYVDIHENVTSIGRQAFSNCKSLETVVIRSSVPPTLTNADSFNNIKSTAKFYVTYSEDHSILAAYQSASYWSTYASKMYELNPDGTIPS